MPIPEPPPVTIALLPRKSTFSTTSSAVLEKLNGVVKRDMVVLLHIHFLNRPCPGSRRAGCVGIKRVHSVIFTKPCWTSSIVLAIASRLILTLGSRSALFQPLTLADAPQSS